MLSSKSVQFFLGVLLFSEALFASSLATENTNMPNTWSSEMLLNLDINQGRRRSTLKDITLSYTYSLMLPDSSSASPSWIETDAYSLGFDWEFGFRKQWSQTLSINLSNQPAEKFSTTGIEYDLTKKFESGQPLIPPRGGLGAGEQMEAQSEEAAFSPSFEFGIKIGYTDLIQKAKIKIGKTLLNDLTEPQVKTGVNARYNITDWFAVSSEYNGYKYSATIGTFITYLNNVNPTGTTGMSTALGQLNVFDWTNKLIFNIGDNWELDLEEQIAEALTNGVTTFLYEATLDYKLSKSFDVELGGGYSYPLDQVEGIFNLVYYF